MCVYELEYVSCAMCLWDRRQAKLTEVSRVKGCDEGSDWTLKLVNQAGVTAGNTQLIVEW